MARWQDLIQLTDVSDVTLFSQWLAEQIPALASLRPEASSLLRDMTLAIANALEAYQHAEQPYQRQPKMMASITASVTDMQARFAIDNHQGLERFLGEFCLHILHYPDLDMTDAYRKLGEQYKD